MKHVTNRRKLLLATGLLAAGAAVSAETAAADTAGSTDIHGTVTFEGGAAIPRGRIAVYLENPAGRDDGRDGAAKTQLESNGGSKAVAFSVASPTETATSPTLQVVAHLEREDGWLLARGSAMVKAGSPVNIMLYTVMY